VIPSVSSTQVKPQVTPQVQPHGQGQPEPQPDTRDNGEAAPAPKQLSKPAVKVQTETQGRIAEPNQTPAPQAATATVAIEPVAVSPPIKGQPEAAAMPHHAVDARPEVAALPNTSALPKSDPVRDLSIRIGDSAGNQVDVKIQEKAGEIHVAVLSNNPSLNTDLRQQVGELAGKLDRAGYHAETFKSTSLAASQQSANASGSGQQQGFAGGQQQQQEEARQQFLNRTKKSNQAQWRQQMSGNLGPEAVEGIEKQ
jgi:hypothetical protein